jgi:branched-chain amino acid transport system permease protein
MEYFTQQLINGLTLGSIYGLIAIGMSIFLQNYVQFL